MTTQLPIDRLEKFNAAILPVCRWIASGPTKEDFTELFKHHKWKGQYFWQSYATKLIRDRDFPGMYTGKCDYQAKHSFVKVFYIELAEVSEKLLFEGTGFTIEYLTDLLHCWFLFTYNFDSGLMWHQVFGEEREKYREMCGKPHGGFVPYVTTHQICKLYTKINHELQIKMLDHAFSTYQQIDTAIEQRKRQRDIHSGIMQQHPTNNEGIYG